MTETWSQRLAAVMAEQGVSPTELARRIERHPSAVSNQLSRVFPPDPETIELIASALQVTTAYLLLNVPDQYTSLRQEPVTAGIGKKSESPPGHQQKRAGRTKG